MKHEKNCSRCNGGDNAPQALVEGVNQAIRDFDDIEIVLYGDETKIKDYLTATERVSIVHTEEKIDSDDEPARAIRRKKQASMVLAAKDVKAGEVDAMLSAGKYRCLVGGRFLYRWTDQRGGTSRFDVHTSDG